MRLFSSVTVVKTLIWTRKIYSTSRFSWGAAEGKQSSRVYGVYTLSIYWWYIQFIPHWDNSVLCKLFCTWCKFCVNCSVQFVHNWSIFIALSLSLSSSVDDSAVISPSECKQLLMECHEIMSAACDLIHARCAKILVIRAKVPASHAKLLHCFIGNSYLAIRFSFCCHRWRFDWLC